MSDTNGTTLANGGGETAPDAPPLVVNAQYAKDFSFENPNAPQSIMAALQEAPQIEVNVHVGARNLQDTTFEVTLTLTATARNNGQVGFVCEVVYAGIFTLTGIPDEHVQPMLLIECPRLLFPFAREMVASATRDGGFPPLMIQPIDFVELYRREASRAASQA
jgi:preprotein translocase subunit SecB